MENAVARKPLRFLPAVVEESDFGRSSSLSSSVQDAFSTDILL